MGLKTSENIPMRQHRIHFHQRTPGIRKNYLRNSQNSRSQFRRSCSQNRFVTPNPIRTKPKHRRVEESSDSETEYAPKKLTSLAISRKSSKSSLKSRLSNMIKYSSNLVKRKRLKSNTNSNAKKLENRSLHSNSNSFSNDDESQSKRKDITNDHGQNDISDEDLDILRELALKSKVQRNTKLSENDIDNNIQKNNNDNNKMDVDEELEELRLVALKSAILKKAIQRKKIKRDDKRNKKERRSVSILDSESELKSVECTNDFGPDMVLETNTENLMYDYNNIYQFYYPLYDNLRNSENSIVDPSNSNKENNDIKHTGETGHEDLLRTHLASLDNNQNMPSSCVSIDTPKDKFENDSDSNLIVRLGGSDTESECEATKNLALMHKKLLVETDFQRNLEVFLKGARQSVTEKDLILFESRSRLTNSNTMLIQNPSEQLMVKSPDNQNEHKMLLERLVELEKSKSAQKQALKKAVELHKLQKNASFNYQIENGVKNPLNTEIIKKDAKRILRPSLLTNRKSSINLENRMIQSDNGHRALEQQLILLRRKIANQSQAVKSIQMEMKGLLKKKEGLIAQIRAATFSLKKTETSLNVSQRSIQVAYRQLTLLQKQHLLLQNRCNKIAPKRNIDTSMNSRIKINEKIISMQQKIALLKENKKEMVSNSTPERITTEKNTDNQIEVLVNNEAKETVKPMEVVNSTIIENDDKNKCTLECEDSEKVENLTDSKEIVIETEGTSLSNSSNEKLSVKSPDVNKCESSTFMEYETPLLGIKSNQSWTNDPQAILCPFDVGGCCKDTSCIYFHPKM